MSSSQGELDVYDGRSDRDFTEIAEIKFEPGMFGKVTAVVDHSGNRFALKKIWFTDPLLLEKSKREIDILSQLNADRVVRFFDAWQEDDDFIFIQMELCKDNLNNVIERKPGAFGRNKEEPMSIFEYFVSWHILKEIVEALIYLHTHRPKIIHRDLKPANVLITEGHNGQFIKLCDLGLAITHETTKSSHTKATGTGKYMAFEVKENQGNTTRYNEKADVFSLAVMALEIFGLTIDQAKTKDEWRAWFNDNQTVAYDGLHLKSNMEKIMDIMRSCVIVNTDNYHDRMSSDTFLERMDEYSVNNRILTVDGLEEVKTRLDQSEDKFFVNFFTSKLNSIINN